MTNNQSEQYRISSVDLLKFFGVISMTFSHCFFFLYRVHPNQNFFYDNSFWGKTLFYNGFNSLVLPCLAGVSFYETLSPYLRAGEFRSIPVVKIMKLLIILGFIESLKNFFTFGLSAAFHWEVLHFIALSFGVMLLFLTQTNMATFFQFVLALFSLNVITDVIFNKTYNFYPQAELGATAYWLNVVYIALLLIGSFWLFFKTKNKTKKILLGLLFVLLFAVSVFYNYSSSEVLVSLNTLPISIFVQLGQIGGHIWPLFPWFILVAYGFLLHHAVVQKIFKRYQLVLLYFACYACFFYFYFFQYDNYRSLLNKDYFFTSGFFKPNSYIVFQLLCFYTCVYSLYHVAFNFIKIRSRFIKEVSDGILVYYVIHIFLAWKLLPSFVFVIDSKWLGFIYPICIFFLTYTFVSAYLFFSQKKIQVNLAKKVFKS